MNPLDGALCKGNWWLFDSTYWAEHQEAKQICARCPALLACDQLAQEMQAPRSMTECGGGLVGTWAGRLYGARQSPSGRGRAKPREHGTERGWQQHRHNSEPKCEPCRLAHNEHVRKPVNNPGVSTSTQVESETKSGPESALTDRGLATVSTRPKGA